MVRVRTLLVILSDRLSEVARRGQLSPRYFNPGEVFDQVDFLLTNNDRVDPAIVQPLVGRAGLALHHVPAPSFVASWGWRPDRLRGWTRDAAQLAATLRPAVVRCYAAGLNALAGVEIKRQLGVPLVLSIHTNPDVRRAQASWSRPKDKLFWITSEAIERAVIPEADVVLPAHESARIFAGRRGAHRVELVYNAINLDGLVAKVDYGLARPPAVVSVGRHLVEKNPEHVIRACAELGASITLIGSGPVTPHLQRVARVSGAKATFIPALPNAEVCGRLASFDVFATHSEYWELSKALLEALLAGLPVVLNRRHGEPVPELAGGLGLLVGNSTAGYAAAIKTLFADERVRRALGQRGREEAERRFHPRIMEQRVADLYRELLGRSDREGPG